MKEMNFNAIGYRYNPEPPDTYREDGIAAAISDRVEEIWANPDLLAIACDELGYALANEISDHIEEQAKDHIYTQMEG